MVYHANLIGDLMETSPHKAAAKLRELLAEANGNGRLVAQTLGVTERQLGRWIKRLRDAHIADLRRFRKKVRAAVPGAVHLDSAGRK